MNTPVQSISHTPCPYCGDPRPLFSEEVKEHKKGFLIGVAGTIICGMFAFQDYPHGRMPSGGEFALWLLGWVGLLFFSVIALTKGIEYAYKKLRS